MSSDRKQHPSQGKSNREPSADGDLDQAASLAIPVQHALAFLMGRGELTDSAVVGLHQSLLVPEWVHRIIQASAAGAKLAANVHARGRSLRDIVQDPGFDWGEQHRTGAAKAAPASPGANGEAQHADAYHAKHEYDWVMEFRRVAGTVCDGKGGGGIDHAKVRAFQKQHGLAVDGMIGPKTIDAAGTHAKKPAAGFAPAHGAEHARHAAAATADHKTVMATSEEDDLLAAQVKAPAPSHADRKTSQVSDEDALLNAQITSKTAGHGETGLAPQAEISEAEKLAEHKEEVPEKCGIGRLKHRRPPKQTLQVQGRGKMVLLEPTAAAAYERLLAHARKDGFQAPLFQIDSGYRDDAKQARLWVDALKKFGSEQAARKWVAPPGHSAHMTGLAIDFYLGYGCSSSNVDKLKKTEAWKWMIRNATQHGFNPYDAEPWHWEFNVG